MEDLKKYGGGLLAGLVLTVMAVFGLNVGGKTDTETKYLPLVITPTAQAPMALAGDARCPSPPRTAGAVFVEYGKTIVHLDGVQTQRQEVLSCDYAGEWSYVLRADKTEQVVHYKGAGSPASYNTEAEINAALADLR